MSREGTSPWLLIYLRNHEAAARGGCDLFARAVKSQTDRDRVFTLKVLRDQVRADLGFLRALMRDHGVRPNLAMGATAQIAERIGRLKPNGRALRRSPLSDLMEIEALVDAVAAKRTGWQALETAGIGSPPNVPSMAELCRRADEQLAQLNALHRDTVHVLSDPQD